MTTNKIEKNYNKQNIFETLDNLKLERKNNNILTFYKNRLLSNSVVTNKYELFDFPTFAKDVVDKIENYFTPEKYRLKITKGTQELRLIGEDVLINGEKYSKMFNILNSTDKSRALQLNVGLIRFICTNGMVVPAEGEALKTKHFKLSLPEKVKKFVESLPKFDLNINNQVNTLESLNNIVSFKEIVEILSKDKDGIISPNKLLKVRAFSKKLLSSNTDKLDKLNTEQIYLLNNSELFNKNEFKNVDIEIPAYQAVNCWTEVYRNYDSSVMKRETKRIIDTVS